MTLSLLPSFSVFRLLFETFSSYFGILFTSSSWFSLYFFFRMFFWVISISSSSKSFPSFALYVLVAIDHYPITISFVLSDFLVLFLSYSLHSLIFPLLRFIVYMKNYAILIFFNLWILNPLGYYFDAFFPHTKSAFPEPYDLGCHFTMLVAISVAYHSGFICSLSSHRVRNIVVDKWSWTYLFV